MTQLRDLSPLYIRADPMRRAVHDPLTTSILGAAFATFGPGGTLITAFGIQFGAIGTFLIRAGLGLALNALTPRPSPPQRGYIVTADGSALDHQIVYGETRIAGARVFDASTGTDNKFLHRVLVFAAHEVEGWTEVYLNDYKLTVNLTTGAVTSAQNSEETTNRYNGLVRIIARNGTADQAAIPEMVSEIPEWTTDHRLRGLAYLYIRLEMNADVFPSGVPQFSATIRGRKVFDPRTSTTAWSNNPALCLRDYLTHPEFGMGTLAGEVDDVLVSQAANICDQTVESEKRYTLNGAILTSTNPGDALSSMLTSMGGLLWHAQGKWRMKPAYYTSPVLALTNDDLRSPLKIAPRIARRDNFNVVRGTFRGPDSNWQVTDYTPVSEAAFVAADGGFETSVDLDLPFTTSHLTAQRIARIALRRQREQVTVSARFGLRAFQVQVGDVVTLTNSRMGWTNKEFEVVSWTFTLTDELTLEVAMDLRETSADVFTSVNGDAFESNNTALPRGFLTAPPQNLQAVSSALIATDGTYVNNIVVRWQAPDDAFVANYEIEWRKTTVTEYTGATTGALEFVIPAVDDDATYAIRVRGVSMLGVRGPFASVTFAPGPDVTAPGDPSSFAAEGDFAFILLSWVNPADRDLDYCEVWEGTTNVLNDATQIAESYGDTYARGNLGPLITRYYWVRAVDASGNKSNFVGPVNATTRRLGDDEISSAATWNDAFNRHDAALGGARGTIQTLYQQVTEIRDRLDEFTEASITDTASLETRTIRIEANFNASAAVFEQELTLLANADTALAAQITSLTATVGANTTAISTLEATRVTADGAVAAVNQAISAEYAGVLALAEATAFAESTVNGISSGFVWSLGGGDVLSLVQVSDGVTPPVTTARIAAEYIRLDGNVEVTGDFFAENDIFAGAAIQSDNFVSGSTGWQISRNGNAQFNNLIVRGSFTADAVSDRVSSTAIAEQSIPENTTVTAAEITLEGPRGARNWTVTMYIEHKNSVFFFEKRTQYSSSDSYTGWRELSTASDFLGGFAPRDRFDVSDGDLFRVQYRIRVATTAGVTGAARRVQLYAQIAMV